MKSAILRNKQKQVTSIQEFDEVYKQDPWLLAQDKNTYSDILADNILQAMTSMEADYALLKWFSTLNVGGVLTINVPDADFYMRIWLDANWSEESLRDSSSEARQSFSALWGEQLSGNPRDSHYDIYHRDTFKSAYNKKRLTFLLERAGFVDIEVQESNDGQLTAISTKSMDKGERQVATDYKNIRVDHKNRYQFACEQLAKRDINKVLDLACGIGYGSLMLAEATNANVTGVDIDQNAVDYAKQYFTNQNTNFICEDAKKCDFSVSSYDAVVSFETIEHVTFDQELLAIFYRALKNGGTFICSTPNQDVMPFYPDKFRFHNKHYTNAELLELMISVGFNNIELFTQMDPTSGPVIAGDNGCFTIAVARK